MTIGTGGIKETLLNGIMHADIHSSQLHLHRFCCFRYINLLKCHDMPSQTIQYTESYKLNLTLDAREFHIYLSILDVAGRNDLRNTSIFVISLLKARNGHTVVTCPVV